MSSPSSCFRCSRLAPLVSPGGLCRDCAATADTSAPTFRPAASPLDPPTVSFLRSHETDTSPASGPRPLPPAPPGYDLVERIGGGGMGEVYLAREHTSERTVAMKFLRHPGDPSAFDRFVIELRVLARLDHPNIVRVYASDFLRADPYFTMEYVPGGSLSRAAGPWAVADAVALVRTVAGAVAVAHGVNIIHRDLKPANVLLAADGTPKVADFGLAKRLDASDPPTATSGALGTPGYMPPEQVSRRNGAIGPWSDVYGLGATLYYLLVGRAPFAGDSVADTIAHVLNDPPERVRKLRPEVPAALEGIVLHCLEKDPKDRYASVAELAADLDEFAAGRQTKAPPLTRWRRLKRWAGRNRDRVLAGAAALALASVLAFVLLTRPAPAANDAETVAEFRRELAAGRPVVLVDGAGRARYKRWAIGTGEFVKPRAGTAAFWSRDRALLELCPDPEVDRYRVSAELRQVDSTDRVAGGPGNGYTVGLYFGYDVREGDDGTKVHAYSTLRFSDSSGPSASRILGGLEYDDNLHVQSPLRWPSHGGYGVAATATAPVAGLPGPWRRFEVELSPDATEVGYGFEDGRPPPVRHDRAGIKARLDKLRGGLSNPQMSALANGVGVADWSPRRSFGVCVHGASIEVRNVTITPLPIPRP